MLFRSLLARSRHNAEAAVEIEESLRVFPSTLPTRRESAYAAWVSIAVGCNNTCTFCIVPSLRGRQRDRRPGEVLAEIAAVAADGAIEVTLLGQNVNSYGVGFGDRGAGLSYKELKAFKEKNGTLLNYDKAKVISLEEFFKLDLDVLIPAALENAIDETVAQGIKAKIVVEAANGPTTPKADEILKDKGITVLPDILSNAGGDRKSK